MNISPHLLIDALILSAALTITLLLRSKVNSARNKKDNKWSICNFIEITYGIFNLLIIGQFNYLILNFTKKSEKINVYILVPFIEHIKSFD